jgi:hypothetical protein
MFNKGHIPKLPGLASFAWWALFIALVGGGIAYYVSMGTGFDASQAGTVRLIISITVLLIGICLVVATSGWWFHR